MLLVDIPFIHHSSLKNVLFERCFKIILFLVVGNGLGSAPSLDSLPGLPGASSPGPESLPPLPGIDEVQVNFTCL